MVFRNTKAAILKVFIALIFISYSTNICAVNPSDDHSEHEHQHGEWEVALVGSGVFLFAEDDFAFGTHLHVLKSLENVKGLNVGIGFEAIFAEHLHFSTSLAAKYMFWDNFGILLAPGVQFVNHQDEWESSLNAHFELIYELELGKYHIGPAVGYSVSKEDMHASVGLHVGYSF